MSANLAKVQALIQSHRLSEAKEACTRLCQQLPANQYAWITLGGIHAMDGAAGDAITCYKRALEIDPGLASVHVNLGMLQRRTGCLDDALESFNRALQLDPMLAVAHMGKGMVLAERGEVELALECLQQVVRLQPGLAGGHYNLGTALQQSGDLDQAAICFHRAVELQPDFADAENNLGLVFKEQGKLSKAADCFRNVIQRNSNYTIAWYNLGLVLQEQGNLVEATTCYRKTLELDPAYRYAELNLGILLHDQGSLAAAANQFRKALELAPDFAEAHNNLGAVYFRQGLIKEAMVEYRRALELKPSYDEAHSNLLAAFNYTDLYGVEEVYRAHVAYGERHADTGLAEAAGHDNSRDAGRRLRVGYVSADFRTHSVAYFFESIVAGHDRGRVEVYCYASVKRPDETTQRLEGLSDHWRDIYRMSDAAVAEQIRADRIDVLVDLGGHTEGHRLKVFARKPAPVQVTYLGYPNTTGVKAIDYRLTDRWVDPEGEGDRWYTESLVRLDGGFLCYRAPAESPEVGPLPVREQGVVTFGCFNNSIKVTPEVVALWGGILRDVPGSRLLLKSRQLADAGVQARFRGLFAAEGIEAGRLELLGHVPGNVAHLALYNRVDIGLDPFPYHGTTTTCEALWMGVPVITLAGDRHASRVGVSLLHQVGLEDWVAHSEEEYRLLAVSRAMDVQALEALRGGLRARMQASSLMDEPGFTRRLESAYRTLWQQWCDQKN